MKLSILHLANHCDRGGNVHLAVDLACCQAAQGHRVAFASAGGRYAGFLDRHDVRHVALSQTMRPPWRAARDAAALVAYCRASRPDVIHAHMMSGAVLGRLASRLVRTPLVTTVHNSFDRHSGLMRLGDVIVAVSEAERELLLARGFPKRRLRVIVNGTLGSARAAEAVGPSATLRRPCVTTLNGLERRKGVHDVIDAFDRVADAAPDWHLVIAGDGPERQVLERQAAGARCSDRISFIGHVEEARSVLLQTDVFVLASYVEPFGLGVLEAREAGCAVIGARVGGIAEQLGADRFGRTFPPGRPDLLADELRLLMTDPAALLDARRRAGECLADYRIERMSRDYIDAYYAAMQNRRAQGGPAPAPALQTSATMESTRKSLNLTSVQNETTE
jgi:glycosyltransferase involved in cell wall biosynthesis